MASYPTGVENHGGFLRIWFIYQGKRVRESLGVPDTPKNRKMAGELRTSVCYAIKTGNFDYSKQFPQSPNASKFGGKRQTVTLSVLAEKWMHIKELELTKNAREHYHSYIQTVFDVIGGERYANSLNQEDLLLARKELLHGFQRPRGAKHKPLEGRKVTTVNGYIACMKAMFDFGVRNGYMDQNPLDGVFALRKEKPQPDPLTKDEYQRVLDMCPSQQMRNIITFAVNTGMRHGEIYALAWEDIDTVKWTVTITRGEAQAGHFTPPKTNSGIRTIQLTSPAIECLKNQMPLTRMGNQHEIEIHLRDNKEKRTDLCTFVFSPRLTSVNGSKDDYYTSGSLGMAWRKILRRAGVRHRKAYETRHTFACWALSAGANPNFVAHQMGHSSAQMLYTVYGKWMTENNMDQVGILNAEFSRNVPHVPHGKTG